MGTAQNAVQSIHEQVRDWITARLPSSARPAASDLAAAAPAKSNNFDTLVLAWSHAETPEGKQQAIDRFLKDSNSPRGEGNESIKALVKAASISHLTKGNSSILEFFDSILSETSKQKHPRIERFAFIAKEMLIDEILTVMRKDISNSFIGKPQFTTQKRLPGAPAFAETLAKNKENLVLVQFDQLRRFFAEIYSSEAEDMEKLKKDYRKAYEVFGPEKDLS
jgi:hypothetical protein